jgi:hypothetical protein
MMIIKLFFHKLFVHLIRLCHITLFELNGENVESLKIIFLPAVNALVTEQWLHHMVTVVCIVEEEASINANEQA